MYIYHIMRVVLFLTPKIVHTWPFRFSNEVTAEVIARTLTATSPRYQTIKELDRKIRDFAPPPQMLEAIRGGPGVDPRSVPLPTSMLTYLLSNIGDISKSTPFPIRLLLEPSKTFSTRIPSSKLFCPSPHRRSRRSNKKPICSVIFGYCTSGQEYHTKGRGTVSSPACHGLSLLDYMDVYVLCHGMYERKRRSGCTAVSHHHFSGCLCIYCLARSTLAPRERCHDRARERMFIDSRGRQG
jgi:hypothetical protein